MTTSSSSRNLWPQAITGFFILFAAFLACFIVFATRQRMDLVRGDYYEAELRYQYQLDRARRAQQLSTQVALGYDASGQCVTVRFPSTVDAAHARGRVHFYRPSDARLDREIPLTLNSSGNQTFDARQLDSGLWRVRIEWSVQGEEFYIDRTLVLPSRRAAS